MATLVSGANVSVAWANALALLQRQGDLVNLLVAIENPLAESPVIRDELDTFIAKLRLVKSQTKTYPVNTVANTIFPSAWYRPDQLGEAARPHLYEVADKARDVLKRVPANAKGTYFYRFISWPGRQGKLINQLDWAVKLLAAERKRGVRNGNHYELGVAYPPCDVVPLPVYAADRNLRGFPCLTHVSITLQEGRLSLAATYRNHDFVRKAYGNYLGLGRLLNFLATESGFSVGEVVCVSSHAEVGLSRRAAMPLVESVSREARGPQ